MDWQVDQKFDEVVPGASDRDKQFLGVLQQRCQSERLDIQLVPEKPTRKSDRVILVAELPSKGWRRRLEVFADPLGSSLHVGWQMTAPVVQTYTRATTTVAAMTDRKDNSAENQRALGGIVQAFHAAVFLPVLTQLTEAMQGAAS